jgi:hypothetical protein
MLNLIPYLLVFTLGGDFTFPPPTKIISDSLFGIQQVTGQDSTIDKYVIKKIKTIRQTEDGSNFVNFCTVGNKYSFKELPFIRLYLLDSGDQMALGRNFPYNYLLFNVLDSSLYHFGGDEKTFLNVIKPGLPYVIKENKSMELAKMYLYTLYNADFYYTLDSIGVYKIIWQEEVDRYKDAPYKIEEVDPENVKEDMNKVKRIFKPVVIQKSDESIKIQIYSWEWKKGNIERWEFSISRDNFKIENRQVILQSVGPHSIKPHD